MVTASLYYPDGFPEEVLEVIREKPNICKYIDIPLQHISSRILKSMKRGMNPGRGPSVFIDKNKGSDSRMAIRTTLITGYPVKR